METLTFSQLPIAGLWWLMRHLRFFFWGCYNRLAGPLKFEYVGKEIKFNGPVHVEHPFSKIRIGSYSRIGVRCYFLAKAPGRIVIGENAYINVNCYITSCNGIQIGDNVLIAENVSIRDYDHEYSDTGKPIFLQGLRDAPIYIGDDVWIGRGVMITSGVTIGKGCIIGANAVVTKDLPDYSIAVGIPARVIRTRKNPVETM